ncbi:MAG TPA: alkaline phosphatase family protein [Thermoanaerobaculia bacterium]|nr:alkaline phosphatase family protein [Thermoanaerobaculia bacterium]
MAVYGLSAGLVSLLLGGVLGRAHRFRFLAWGITVALAVAALLGWLAPSRFAYYLSPAINERLLKAATGLTVCAVVAFYTALLHTAWRRRYGRGSLLLLGTVVLTANLLLYERRSAIPPPSEPIGQQSLLEASRRLRLVVVGIDSASLEAILPLVEEGSLPFLGTLLEGGAWGHLRSIRPPRFSSLWTTISTGQFPYRHGITSSDVYSAPWLGEKVELRLLPPLRPLELWLRFFGLGRAIDAGDRESIALWELLASLGIPTGVVGWPVATPFPPGLAFGVSDRFLAGAPPEGEVVPLRAAEWARSLRGVTEDLGRGVSPILASSSPLRTALAEDLTRLALLNRFLESEPDRAAGFVLLPGLRTASRSSYGGFAAVHFEGLREREYLVAEEALRAYYVQLDGLLENLWQRQEGPTLLVLVSAYGVEGASGWRRVRAALIEEKALEGYVDRAPPGLFLLYGEGVRPAGRIAEATLVDLQPTLLYALGLPIGRDLAGKLLRDVYPAEELSSRPQTFVASYEALRP